MTARPATRVVAPLLTGCLLLAGCPHDFGRAHPDAAQPDAAAVDLPAPDVDMPAAPDAWVQLDTVPTPDAACPLPCVTTLPSSYTQPEGVALGPDTLAGDGTPTLNNGTGTAASFNHPHGLALDSSGSLLYVADTYNSRIRVIQLK